MGVVTTAYGRIGVDECGGGALTPIVFLHGVGSDKSVWRLQLDHFGATRRALAFDYPGYGDSDFLPDATRDDFAAAILAALDALGIGKAHICGLSLGGVVAIAMHALAPDRCASLILADSFAVHPDGPGIYERSIAASQSMGMRALAEARVGNLVGAATPCGARNVIVSTMSRIDPEAYALGAHAVWLADQSERVREIAAPTLIIVGDEDRITPPALSEELAAMIPGASLVQIAGAGHLANFEKPADFNRAISEFLEKID